MKKILLSTILAICFSAYSNIDTINVASNNYTPSSLTIDLGDTVRFIWVSGSHPTVSDNGMWSTFQMNSGSTSFDLILASDGTYPYHCQFHGGAGGVNMSGTINVVSAPTPTSIASQPINDTITEGGTATFSLTTVSEDSLQWQLDDGSGFNNIIGETSPTLIINATTLSMDGNNYRCMVFGSPNVTSDTVLLKVNPLPVSNIPTVLVQNNEYIPASISVDVNDTVRFKWVEGVHPTESVTGEFSTFTLDDTDSINDIVFTSEGTYKYFCQFHGGSDGTGMAGEVIVGNPPIDGINSMKNSEIVVGPNPFINNFTIVHNFENLDKIEIINILGEIELSVDWKFINNLNVSVLNSGNYFLRALDSNGLELSIIKIVKE